MKITHLRWILFYFVLSYIAADQLFLTFLIFLLFCAEAFPYSMYLFEAAYAAGLADIILFHSDIQNAFFYICAPIYIQKYQSVSTNHLWTISHIFF